MAQYVSQRKRWFDHYSQLAEGTRQILEGKKKGAYVGGRYYQFNPKAKIKDVHEEMISYFHASYILERAKTIIFDSNVANTLARDADKKHISHFSMPFNSVLIQFTELLDGPAHRLAETVGLGRNNLMGIAIHREHFTREEFLRIIANGNKYAEKIGMGESFGETYGVENTDLQEIVIDSMAFLYKGGPPIPNIGVGYDPDMWTTESIRWLSGDTRPNLHFRLPSQQKFWRGTLNMWRLLGIKCLEYVDQTSVLLEKQEGAPEKVNRKREREGKRILEDYYICRIRETRIESHATGEGTEHGHRYDVRSHTRRLKDGRTVRVKAHQRGLKHEQYIPKTYYQGERVKEIA